MLSLRTNFSLSLFCLVHFIQIVDLFIFLIGNVLLFFCQWSFDLFMNFYKQFCSEHSCPLGFGPDELKGYLVFLPPGICSTSHHGLTCFRTVLVYFLF